MAEKMLTNWFTFLLYKFLKVSRREPGWEGHGKPEAQEPRCDAPHLTLGLASPLSAFNVGVDAHSKDGPMAAYG